MCKFTFESASVNLQTQTGLPVSSAVDGKLFHGGKICTSPSYFELFAFVFIAFTVVYFHENVCNKTWNEFCAFGIFQSMSSLTQKRDFYNTGDHAVFILQSNMK